MPPSHPWKARLIVSIILLLLAFLGIIATDIRTAEGWNYWKWAVFIYALLALWLSWYVKRKKQTLSLITIWHELLHWGGLIGAIFLISHLAQLGTISLFIAGIFNLILISFALFLAGIYIESSFLIVGVLLAIFALVTATLTQYLYIILIPLLIAGAAAIGVSIWFSHKRFNKTQQD